MVDISDSKFKHMIGKPWSAWNLPGCSNELDYAKLREAYRPKEPQKPKDHCNLLPQSVALLYGTRPEAELFSVTKCPACRSVMKTQWMARHYKRDSSNNLVCRRTEFIVIGGRCIGKATSPLYEIKESVKDPLAEFATSSTSKLAGYENFTIPPQLSPKHKIHKSEHSSSHHSSSSKSKSSISTSSSHSKEKEKDKKHSSSSSSSTNKHKSSSSSKSTSSSSLWSSSSKKESSKSEKSHKSHSSSYVLSIPSSSDSGISDSVESILHSSSKKSKLHEPEYEQLKFYADSSDKRSKSSHHADLEKGAHRVHFSPQLENFKIPLKNKSSSSTTSSNDCVSKRIKLASGSLSTKSLDTTTIKIIRASPSVGPVTVSKPSPSLTIISEPTRMNTPPSQPIIIDAPPPKEKSHSKKKKKKKSKDEPRKIIPLKERAFNPDQHCGVCVSEHGPPCTRSLTCKTHSISLRRGVPGRSQSFDSLLAAHKKARDEEKSAKSGKDSPAIVPDPPPPKPTPPPAPIIVPAKPKGGKKQPAITFTYINPAEFDALTKSISAGKNTTTTTSSSSAHPPAKPIGVNSGGVASLPSPSTGSNNSKPNVAGSNKTITRQAQAQTTSHPIVTRQTSKPQPPPASAPPPPPVAPPSKSKARSFIIMKEKKEPPTGKTMDEIRKDHPENRLVFLSTIKDPKTYGMGNSKTVGAKNKNKRNINALTEWNRMGGKYFLKKRGPNDPIITLLPYSVTEKEVITIDDTVPIPSEGEIMQLDDSSLITSPKLKVKVRTKRSNSEMSGSSDKPLVVISSKRARVLTLPRKLYESLIEKAMKKRQAAQKILVNNKQGETKSTTVSTSDIIYVDDNNTVVKTAIHMMKNQMSDIEFEDSNIEVEMQNAQKFIINEDVSSAANDYLRSFVRAHADNTTTAVDVLSQDELSQRYMSLAERVVII